LNGNRQGPRGPEPLLSRRQGGRLTALNYFPPAPPAPEELLDEAPPPAPLLPELVDPPDPELDDAPPPPPELLEAGGDPLALPPPATPPPPLPFSVGASGASGPS